MRQPGIHDHNKILLHPIPAPNILTKTRAAKQKVGVSFAFRLYGLVLASWETNLALVFPVVEGEEWFWSYGIALVSHNHSGPKHILLNVRFGSEAAGQVSAKSGHSKYY